MPVSPPRPKGPPLNALRAFEAAARLGGFNNAAEELCVTAGAISQHIKTLEDWSGVKLFERRSQGVVLTDIGQSMVKEFTTAFDVLGEAVRLLRNNTQAITVNIAALPSIAQLWLSPRLPEIRQSFPHINISITVLENPPNLKREIFDISLFFEDSDIKAQDNIVVLEEDLIVPVCSPEISKILNKPEDLKNVTCLYDVLWPNDWSIWLSKVAPDVEIPKNGPSFSLFSIAVEETKNGAGVLVGHKSLVDRQIKKGELVAPFNHPVSSGKSLVLRFADNQSISDDLKKVIDVLSKTNSKG